MPFLKPWGLSCQFWRWCLEVTIQNKNGIAGSNEHPMQLKLYYNDETTDWSNLSFEWPMCQYLSGYDNKLYKIEHLDSKIDSTSADQWWKSFIYRKV